MIPFLYNVAQAFFRQYGNEVSNFAFVFPNRRAGLFFQKYLSEIAKRPLFSPQILTISELFTRLSGLATADRIEQLFILYSAYKRLSGTEETFDEFLFWGEMLLNDFDDVDKYMVEAKQLFSNIQDLKEIDAGFSYLTEEQIIAIRRFWSSFIPVGDNDKKKEFLEMWQVLFELYSALREELRIRGLAYEGMIFREVADLAKADADFDLPSEHIVFVGLNAHSLSEEQLLRYLYRRGVADFYWDYSSSLVKDPDNKASAFIAKNRMLFPSKLTLEAEDVSFEKPILEVIGIPSSVGQAKFVHSIIRSLMEEKQIGSADQALNTAVVLSDENLLLPTLYSIPKEIDKINVTMGYGLINSSISGLMDHIFELQRNIRVSGGGKFYYFRFVLPILNHRYVLSIVGDAARNLRQQIIQYNKIQVSVEEFAVHPLLALIFSPVEDWAGFAPYLREILARLESSLSQTRKDRDEDDTSTRSIDMECEFIIEYYKTINKMEDALKNVEAEMKVETYVKLLKKLIAGISVPFSGEPLSGLQIMGILETRALDFENLIMLSMNEGIFPMKKAANSFIPYNLRRGFGLPAYEHQDSIFAYHFYRLINRAKHIYMLYDTRTEGLQGGEVSRYFYQLKHLYSDVFDICERLAVYEVSSSESVSIAVTKTPQVITKLRAFQTGERSLSASSINTYLDCPLQFYFSVVEKMEDEDEVAETIEANTFGSIFHSVMEWVYEPYKGRMLTADILQKIGKDDAYLTGLIERSFADNYFKIERVRKLTGQNYLTGEVLKRYVKKVLSTDAKLAPFIYVDSEKRITELYKLPSGRDVSLKGFIDRIDEVRGHTRIIDYKTGRGVLQFKNMADLFDKEMKDRPKAVMQVFMYAHLYLNEFPNVILESGIYYLRNLFDSNFNPLVEYRLDRTEKKQVSDFFEFRQDFKDQFDKCLEEIFDEQVQFYQTPTGKACEWCAFTGICKK
ncbi:PD-(D/E)XK nuclease family protein [Dysgonomonas macrotermitis]|uniref:PD-(D/E)XK nuclease superfamily protein n=1 Tax=Dysgonomonas macrotermitis TaxID=1346286 RepID=A0A1M4WMZ6_9BACT|nr:PD-(D/E)XK nuclease family protein [Dysgonomonas macrotermitis]SHE82588.1 PD-(D/E)XK nuclease superfamily protein [Dysgonomonas macrotermitis]